MDARIVEQAAEVFALVGERHDAGPLLLVVGFAVMSAAMLFPDALKLLDDALDAVGEQAGKQEIAEAVEELELLFSEACV